MSTTTTAKNRARPGNPPDPIATVSKPGGQPQGTARCLRRLLDLRAGNRAQSTQGSASCYRFAMQPQRLTLLTFLIVTAILHADSLPAFDEPALLSDANVLRMTPPFETRYYFTFQIGAKQSVTVIHDIYYDSGRYDESRNRVIIENDRRREFLVPRSDYVALYERLPKSLILAEKSSIGISLQDCVASYAKLLADLRKP
jgi:hypothetical protein